MAKGQIDSWIGSQCWWQTQPSLHHICDSLSPSFLMLENVRGIKKLRGPLNGTEWRAILGKEAL